MTEDSETLRIADALVRIAATEYMLSPNNALVGQLYLNMGCVMLTIPQVRGCDSAEAMEWFAKAQVSTGRLGAFAASVFRWTRVEGGVGASVVSSYW